MRGNPFMPQGVFRKGMHDSGKRSTSEVVGIGLQTLKPIAQAVGSVYGGPAAGAAIGSSIGALNRGFTGAGTLDDHFRRAAAEAALYGGL